MKESLEEAKVNFFVSIFFSLSLVRLMPHRQKALETAAATAASAYRRLLRAAESLPEGPVRTKAVANVRSLGREGGKGGRAAAGEETTSSRSSSSSGGGADIRGEASLTAFDALSATLLFRWVARLPKVRFEWRGKAKPDRKAGDIERKKEEERSMASKEEGAPFFPFSHPTSAPPQPLRHPPTEKQDQLSALLDGHFTSPSNKKAQNKNEKE